MSLQPSVFNTATAFAATNRSAATFSDRAPCCSASVSVCAAFATSSPLISVRSQMARSRGSA